jgi:hypothetical protein
MRSATATAITVGEQDVIGLGDDALETELADDGDGVELVGQSEQDELRSRLTGFERQFFESLDPAAVQLCGHFQAAPAADHDLVRDVCETLSYLIRESHLARPTIG